ncbi:MAG TPA: ERF family protein [Terracidiphilus sp.]
MQRSSESIASLAAALAKAQIELSNPEKSLVATIRADGPGGSERAFRYAPLSSGLDIVRKTLGQHEIATVQTTAIDQTAGIVNLTTVLAHASGEWIASDWPVCAISETVRPRRMGAALTYARRYALFTLVGIAGEDDLDAPDLMTPQSPEAGPQRPKQAGNSHLNGGHHGPVQSPPRRDKRHSPKSDKPILGPKESAQLRDRLLGEIGNISSAEDAALWAYCNLRAKNGLTTADAGCVEEAFQTTLATFVETVEESEQPSPSRGAEPRRQKKRQRPTVIDKSVLALPEPRRARDRDHVRYVATQACLVCGRQPCDAHHLRFAQSRALGRKVSDEYTVPLCRGHHREVHRYGDEAAWWTKVGIDPTAPARVLWLSTHPLPTPSENMAAEDATSTAGYSAVHANPGGNHAAGKRTPNDETNPIVAGGVQ